MKNYTLVCLIFILFCNDGVAQDLASLLQKGDKLFGKKDYPNALKTYLEAYKLAPDDAATNFRVGVSYLHADTKSKALPYLEKAYELNASVDEDIDYHMGMAYQYNHKYAKAIDHYTAFKNRHKSLSEIANHKIAECEVGDSLVQHPTYVAIENFGPEINTEFHEYSPLISEDGTTMIFTSNRSDDETKVKMGTNYEDIYLTHRTESGWSAPQKISANINIKFNDAAASLSADGKTLFLYYEDGAGDIYTSKLVDGQWTTPAPLNKNINTPLFWETSACISADGKKLYFTSNRPGGLGELDIYVSELEKDGEWGKAVNLGPTINTPFHEDSPFIHHDGVTLYFSSDGHPTMGSNDIFRSELKKGKWTKPVNMGYPINSIEYDGFFMLSVDKKIGYYSALRDDGLGNADIYSIRFLDPPVLAKKDDAVVASIAPAPEIAITDTLAQADTIQLAVTPAVIDSTLVKTPAVKTDTVAVAEQVKQDPQPDSVASPTIAAPIVAPIVAAPVVPPPAAETFVDPLLELQRDMKIVTMLKGKVIDEVTAEPLGAVITLVNNETQKVVTRITSNPATGDFELIIPHGGNFGVSTEKLGYLFNSINFNLPQFAEYQEIDTHIIMVKAEVGSKVVLKNIFFDVGKSDLKNESVAELEKIKELLALNPSLKVQINGHTDITGSTSANMLLSLRRAEAVVAYLVKHGVGSDRVSAKGFGSQRPIVSNDDEQEGRELNRRTEIEIIGS